MLAIEKLYPLIIAPVRILPFELQKNAFERWIKFTFAEAIADGEMEFLVGHCLKIEITDLKIIWYVFYDETSNPEIMAGPHPCDISITARLKEFIYLVNTNEQSVSVFTADRMKVEGQLDLVSEMKSVLLKAKLGGIQKMVAQLLQKYLVVMDGASTGDNRAPRKVSVNIAS